MGNTVEIKGKNMVDASIRKECLQAIANEATTDELQKLKKAMSNPELRAMLQMI